MTDNQLQTNEPSLPPPLLPESAEVAAPKRGRGRPSGQFDLHKLYVLRFLQEFTIQNNGEPYQGSNDDLCVAMGEWGKHFRVGVSPRQVARYLQKLQNETTAEGKPRVEVVINRYKGITGAFCSKRSITVNDTKTVNL